MNRISPTLVYTALIVMLVLSGLDQTLVSTALPTIARDLGAHGDLSWVFSAYLIASTTVIPLYGKLADRWGTRAMLIVSTGLFALGSLACAGAASMPALIVARGVQGLGGGGLLTLTMLGAAALFPPAERGKRMSMLGAAYGLSTMVGPLVGALFVEHLSWRWAFGVNVPVAVIALAVIAAARFDAPRALRHALDVLGAALLAAGLVTLLVAIDRPHAELRGALFAASALLLVVWAVAQRRAEDPVLPLSMFAREGFTAAVFISVITGVALYTVVVFLPLYLQAGLHLSAIASAWQLLPLMLGITVAAQVAGRLLRARVAVRPIMIASALMAAAGFGGLAWVFARGLGADGLHVGAISACIFPIGAGIGLSFPTMVLVTQAAVPAQQIGIATATPVMVRALGGALAAAAVGEAIQARLASLAPSSSGAAGAGLGHPHAAEAMAGALGSAYGTVALVALTAAVAVRWLPKTVVLPGRPAAPAAPRAASLGEAG